MDEEREARVWARVRGERVLPLGDCAQCAGIYRWLYKRDICRETAAGLLKQQTEQLEILRGLLALNGQPEPDWVAADPVGMTEAQAAAKGVELCRALAAAYAALAADPTFGGLFARLSAQSWSMTGDALRVYRRVKGK